MKETSGGRHSGLEDAKGSAVEASRYVQGSKEVRVAGMQNEVCGGDECGHN